LIFSLVIWKYDTSCFVWFTIVNDAPKIRGRAVKAENWKWIKHDDYGMNANEGEFPVAATITQLIVPNRTITHQFLRCLCIFLPRRPTFDHSFPLIISHISQETYFILSTTQFRSVIRNTRHYQVYRWIIAFVSSSISGHSSLSFIIR